MGLLLSAPRVLTPHMLPVSIPHAAARIHYVDPNGGNDGTATPHHYGVEYTDGEDPREVPPSGGVNAYLTIAQAVSDADLTRGDWILLLGVDFDEGETFPVISSSGPNADEPAVFGTYVIGLGTPRRARLQLNGTASTMLRINPHAPCFLQVWDIDFYSPEGDPTHVDFNATVEHGHSLSSPWGALVPNGVRPCDLQFFYCRFQYCNEAAVQSYTPQDAQVLRGVKFHRCIFSEMWNGLAPPDDRCQGLFSQLVDLELHECVFYYGGWYDGDGRNRTAFDHNLYVINMGRTLVRGCLFAHPRAKNIKCDCDKTYNSVPGDDVATGFHMGPNRGMTVQHCLIVGGTQGIGFDHSASSEELVHIGHRVLENVISGTGATQNGSSDIVYGIGGDQLRDLVIDGNYLVHRNGSVSDGQATSIGRRNAANDYIRCRDTAITNNTVHDFGGSGAYRWPSQHCQRGTTDPVASPSIGFVESGNRIEQAAGSYREPTFDHETWASELGFLSFAQLMQSAVARSRWDWDAQLNGHVAYRRFQQAYLAS